MIAFILIFIFVLLLLIFVAMIHWLGILAHHLASIDRSMRQWMMVDTEPYSAKPIPDDYDINMWSSQN